jgi:Pyridine nucleotide-disulphide oxidoreductase
LGADLDVAVIGAGPHGLSATVHLRRTGVAAQLFGTPMSFWRAMPKGMKLRSSLSATNLIEPAGPLSLKTYVDMIGEEELWPVSERRFIEYGLWVQRTAVPDVDCREVTHVEQQGAGFAVTLGDGTRVSARRVVVAAGIRPFQYIPDQYRHLPADRISHTGDHSDMSVFAGRRVAVVGGGQSAFECATIINERGAASTEVIVREPEVVWLRSYSPKTLLGPLGPLAYSPTDVGPLWFSRLVGSPDLFRLLPRETQRRIAYRSIRPACSYFVRVRLDEVKVSLGVELAAVEPTPHGLHLRLSDGTEREVDHVMFGTGYRLDVAKYAFLADDLVRRLRLDDGYPVLGRGLESSVPGLHFLGAPAARSFGPILRFVSGSWYGGRAVARAGAGGRLRRPLLARAGR